MSPLLLRLNLYLPQIMLSPKFFTIILLVATAAMAAPATKVETGGGKSERNINILVSIGCATPLQVQPDEVSCDQSPLARGLYRQRIYTPSSDTLDVRLEGSPWERRGFPSLMVEGYEDKEFWRG